MDRINQVNNQQQINKALDKSFELLLPWSYSHKHERDYMHMVIKSVLDYVPNRDARIMDLGSGVGILSIALRLLGYKVDGVEKYVFSDKESPMYKVDDVEKLKKVWQDYEFNVSEFDVAGGIPDSFNEKYEVVINTAVIEHVKNPKLFLNSIYKLLKPKGVVITMTPNLTVLHQRLRFALGRSVFWDIKEFFDLGEKGFTGHWREYTKAELIKMHEWSGFSVIKAINTNIFSLTKKMSFCNILHLLVRLISLFIFNSKEANIIIAQKS